MSVLDFSASVQLYGMVRSWQCTIKTNEIVLRLLSAPHYRYCCLPHDKLHEEMLFIGGNA
jgi:hypothetical protein